MYPSEPLPLAYLRTLRIVFQLRRSGPQLPAQFCGITDPTQTALL